MSLQKMGRALQSPPNSVMPVSCHGKPRCRNHGVRGVSRYRATRRAPPPPFAAPESKAFKFQQMHTLLFFKYSSPAASLDRILPDTRFQKQQWHLRQSLRRRFSRPTSPILAPTARGPSPRVLTGFMLISCMSGPFILSFHVLFTVKSKRMLTLPLGMGISCPTSPLDPRWWSRSAPMWTNRLNPTGRGRLTAT